MLLKANQNTRPDKLLISSLVKASLKCYHWATELWVFGKTKKQGEISEAGKRPYI